MSNLCILRAAEDFTASGEFKRRLKAAKRDMVHRKITDVRWEQYHGDEITSVLVLDDGQTMRGPILGEYSTGGFE